MVNMDTSKALWKIKSQVLSYKQETEFAFICFVKKACNCMYPFSVNFNQILLSFVDNIFYERIESVNLVCQESHCRKNAWLFPTLHCL